MKKILYSVSMTLFMVVTITSNIAAQDSPQWHLPEGAKMRLGKGRVKEIAFFPVGTRLAVASSVGIWITDTETGEELDLLIGHTDDEGRSIGVQSVAFSPDGQILASGSDWPGNTIRLSDAKTGAHIYTLSVVNDRRYYQGPETLAFSPDSRMLASGSSKGSIHLWDVQTGSHIRSLTFHADRVTSVAFCLDGRTLASASWDRTVMLWDVQTGSLLRTLNGHTDDVNSVAFSPDGKTIVSAGNDGIILLWDVQTGSLLRTLNGDTNAVYYNPVYSVVFSPDGQTLVSGGRDTQLWDSNTGTLLRTLEGHTSWFVRTAFSPDGKTIASASSSTIHLSDARTGRLIRTFEGYVFGSTSVAFSPNGKTIASDGDDGSIICLWDANTGRHLRTLSRHTNSLGVNSIAFSPDGKTIVSGGWDNAIWLWDANTGIHIRTLGGHTGAVNSVAFSPDGKIIASGSGTWGSGVDIRLWDANTGIHIRTLEGHTDDVNSVAFSPDGKIIASGSQDETIRLWDVNTGALLRTLNAGESRTVWSVVFSPDGQTLVSGAGYIHFWDANTGSHLRYHTAGGNTSSIAFSPDGQTLVSGGGWRVHLWDVKSGNRFRTFEGHTDFVEIVAFSPDGTTIASGSRGGTVLLWELKVLTHAEDINTDGIINIQDLVIVASNFGARGENAADVNRDGIVNIIDLTLVAGAFGNTTAAPSMRDAVLEHFTAIEVEQWLRAAQHVNLTDPTFQRGILMLEQLLIALTPTETVLLPNYPNPFNPETWIPYQLAKDAKVTLHIYTVNGTLVRTLTLGHQPVGIYQSKSRAAYWDGKNEVGEPVASSVYFYTLKAGDFTATRKMLIQK